MKSLRFDTLPADHLTRLGLIVLQSDVTIEDEFRYYLDGLPVSLLVNRIPFENEVTVETLKQMEGHLTTSMSLFPIDAEFDCMGYGCTSGALHIGDDAIAGLCSESRPCKSVTSPMQAALAAMAHMNVKKIAYLAPYSQRVSQSMVYHFEKNGVEVTNAATFDEKHDMIVGRISPESIKKECIDLVNNSSAEAVFISCTNMKCAHIIPDIEKETGVVVLSSNQVLAWHMTHQVGLAKLIVSKGRLFSS